MSKSHQNNNDDTQNVMTPSRVTPEKSRIFAGKWVHWVVLLMISILVISVMSFGGKKQTEALSTPTTQNRIDYGAELKSNLAHLNEGHEKSNTKEFFISPNISPNISSGPPLSKDYIARQNAPTRMYNAELSATSKAALATENNTAILSDENPYSRFANHEEGTTTINAARLLHPEYTIASGEFIHAVLETAINSDLPGLVRAVISEPVYAYTGNKPGEKPPLIPAGSRLIGQYTSKVSQGMERVFVVWNRIILPSGITVDVSSPGSDLLGTAGMNADEINTHFFERFGEATLLSVMGAGVALDGVNSNGQDNSESMYRGAVAGSFQQSAQASLQNSLSTAPTLKINQGAAITVFVAHDLSFYDVLTHERDESDVGNP